MNPVPMTRGLLAWTFLVYVAVLPAAETIALRHLAMAMALLLVAYLALERWRNGGAPWSAVHMTWEWMPLAAWWGYLCIFPLLSGDSAVAWQSSRDDWLMSIGAAVIGFTCGSRNPRTGGRFLHLALASMAVVMVHWLLILLSWSGLLGSEIPQVMSWTQIGNALLHQIGSDWRSWLGHGTFRWQFHGFDPDHGNLGLAATQSVALLLPAMLSAWDSRNRSILLWTSMGLLLCIGSVLIAMSRGALLFCVLVLVTGLVLHLLLKNARVASLRSIGPYGVALALTIGLIALAIAKDSRWHLLQDKIRIAWIVEEPAQFFCEGMTSAMEANIRSALSEAPASRVDAVISGMSGDGGRLLAARAGFSFVLDHPWGVDGSRHVFKQLMQESCGVAPKIEFAHTHNGWLDLLLALGWAGGALYLSAMIGILVWALKYLRENPSSPWGLALVLTLVFWLLRGLVDSVYREHALLMQAAWVAYLTGRVRRGPP